MYWIKKNWINLILSMVFLIGLGLLLYPTLSDYWNSFHQSRAIASYAQDVAEMNDVDYEEEIQAARNYNEKVAAGQVGWVFSDEQKKEYESVLNVSGTGIMGYIEIDKIKCSLPIYHGTSEGVLQIAIGHIEGSSLPIGGENTHTVLSGHRGLPSAKLFSDLDQMENGDVFMIRTLDEVLTYEVDQILIVEPNDISSLEIEAGKDLCTLVTCTPYGVNTHRLLVRGHRIETTDKPKSIRVTADAIQIDTILVMPFVAVPILLLLIIIVWIATGKKKRNHKKEQSYDK